MNLINVDGVQFNYEIRHQTYKSSVFTCQTTSTQELVHSVSTTILSPTAMGAAESAFIDLALAFPNFRLLRERTGTENFDTAHFVRTLPIKNATKMNKINLNSSSNI